MLPRLSALVVLAILFSCSLAAGPRDAQWAQVDEAVTQRLPKTAIERLEPIVAGALADKSYAEATKAIARKIVLEGEIEGGGAEEQIFRLEKQMAALPAPMKPMMEAILAHWYWSYYQENRWKYMERTRSTGDAGSDIRTWDLPRILTEIDRHFTAALADEALLQRTPIATFDDLLEKWSIPDRYRPTLFDFLAHEALKFYQAGEQGAVEAEDTFVLDAASPIFGTTDEFLRWQPAASTTAPLPKAVRLHQALLRFHQADADRSAWFDADLARLTFGFNATPGEETSGRYQAAMQRFIEATSTHELSAHALAALARHFIRRQPARARELAQQGHKAFPHSPGGAMCFNIIQEIETPTAQLETEFVWSSPLPTLDITYNNVTKVYFRAVQVPYAEHLREARWNVGNFSREQSDRLIAATPVLAWSADLPRTTDYLPRTEKLPAPAKLSPGFYAILASHEPGFGNDKNQLSVTTVWVSDLALITQSRGAGRPNRGFVLMADSGEPVAGADVRVWRRDHRRGEHVLAATVRSDANGQFDLPKGDQQQQLILLAEHHGQAVSTHRIVATYDLPRARPAITRTVLFTDRALYRPGQSISYKGICVSADHAGGNYAVLAHEKVDVIFQDQNGQEIDRNSAVTNAHGSFSGVFTTPRDRVLGHMSIRVNQGPGGAAHFRVEEYKRPKFEVKLAAPAEAAKLGETVTLTGKALAYTGASIGGAQVKWNVVRRTNLPPWCWWRRAEERAIGHGTATTAPDGSFSIQFQAVPDRTVSQKLEPVFSYMVHADVTDTTGETRSDERSVAAGYTALRADLAADTWQTARRPVELAINTRSLDDVPQAASGKVTIHALKQPAKVTRPSLSHIGVMISRTAEEPPLDPANPDSWESGAEVLSRNFKTDASGAAKLAVPLPAGIYRASLETSDRFGRRVTARRTVEVVDPDSRRYGVKVPNFFAAEKWSVEPGEKFTALWGTGYATGRAFVEIECNGQPLQSFWTAADRTQQRLELPVTEAMRGGATVSVTFVRENRAYFNTREVTVPWSNKELAVKWETFRSKLLPGQKETWTATVAGRDATTSMAELVATLYDASLDQFQPHRWPDRFGVFRTEQHGMRSQVFHNTNTHFNIFQSEWELPRRPVDWSYRSFPEELIAVRGDQDNRVVLSPFMVTSSGEARGYAAAEAPAKAEAGGLRRDSAGQVASLEMAAHARMSLPGTTLGSADDSPSSPKPNLDGITARRNLNETAFFFPHLLADANGTVKLQFTMPEALTRWKFLGFAHDKELRAGLLTGETVTAKDLMVQPNPPRFVREGDAIEFTVKVSNQTDRPQTGQVRLTFADAATLAPVDIALGNRATEQTFNVPAKESRTYSWRIAIPDGMGFLTYKAVGATSKASDGEEGSLPVLSRRILVTASLPLPIRGRTTKEFDFTKLSASGQSDTLRHQSLTVQMVSQPAWYAVMALPYLMEFPYECSEQIFSRLYANALARHIANSDPKIRRIFDQWKGTPALDSPLTKNQDLKSVMLEETPWLRQSNKESESRRNVGLLFDANRLDEETSRALQQLAERQHDDGLWAWFPGGGSNEYISLTIVTGFGRLRHLGLQVDDAPALRALPQLDAWLNRRYQEIQRGNEPDKYEPTSIDALYLYGRSFFLAKQPVAQEHQPAVEFFLRQARLHWTKLGNRQSEAHLALGLFRFGDRDIPAAIAKSLKERSVNNEELGMFWRDTERSWWWWHAPIETQAMMIEVFAEITRDQQAIEDCQVWLLKQKQTQDWKTTRATADAIYGLLLQGGNLLKSDAIVEVSLGGTPIKPAKVEAGTGFYEQKFIRDEIKPAMGRITVKKSDDGVSWGSAHWQYLEDMAKVTPYEGTPLKLRKALFIKETTAQGPVLKPVTGPVAVGDELVVRLELRTDRDMEYVHLKDQRGSGTEPVNVLSQYKYQDGLGYYESTRDTASHFFIDYLRKGTYVFEYSVRVQLRGNYQSGIAEIQCMYAPEFNSHSESMAIEVR
jgi:hypothetical protein